MPFLALALSSFYFSAVAWAESPTLLPAAACPAHYASLWRAARPPEAILVVGGGRSGAISPFLMEGIAHFRLGVPGSRFETASRSSQDAWAGSKGHFSGVDRNDGPALARMLEESKPSLIIDVAGAHMSDALKVTTIEEARALGARQARMLLDYQARHPRTHLVFVSSQYADPAMKDTIDVSRTFEVVGMPRPVSVRLYAELKAGYEEALRAEAEAAPKLTILRLGTLLSPGYRAKSAQALVEAGGDPKGKNFTPDEVLRDSVGALLGAIQRGERVPSLLEVSSKDEFRGPRALGVEPAPLGTYVERLRRAWGN